MLKSFFTVSVTHNFDIKTFVMQCDEDYKLFNKLVCDTGEALGRPVRLNTWARPGSAVIPEPMSRDEVVRDSTQHYCGTDLSSSSTKWDLTVMPLITFTTQKASNYSYRTTYSSTELCVP